jgi:SAM-dependent methyltransferase
MRNYLRGLPLYGHVLSPLFSLTHPRKERFTCPVCGYRGPFIDAAAPSGPRRHARCPRCASLERHRLQYLVMRELAGHFDFSRLSLLHFAPEPFFRRLFRRLFGAYTSADLSMRGVDLKADLRALPVEDADYDVVFASHVLEHIREDRQAIREIRRVLRPGGFAVLPVPVVAPATVEYPEPKEAGHVRAPGLDYYERYLSCFASVEVHTSADYPEEHQTYSYEDRTGWPTPKVPLRPPMPGERHPQSVPVCLVGEEIGLAGK